MVPSNFGYSLRECGHHFRRNWTTVLGAVVTIFLSLFIIGLFIVGSAMLTSVIGDIEQEVTINVYVSDDASDEYRDQRRDMALKVLKRVGQKFHDRFVDAEDYTQHTAGYAGKDSSEPD